MRVLAREQLGATSGWLALGLTAIAALPFPGAAGASSRSDPPIEPMLVSRADGASGAKGNGPSRQPAISADGRFVAFESTATNLAPEDTDSASDVFVRDLKKERTILVSGPIDGVKLPESSADPSISANGRFVAFASTAPNLAPGTPTPGYHVHVRDLRAGVTYRVDQAPDGTPANAESGHPAISATGRFVAFDSAASNLDPADPPQPGDLPEEVDVYLRDLATGTTTLVSHRDEALPHLGNPAVAADGRRVVYRTRVVAGEGDAAELLPGRAFARNLGPATTASFDVNDDVLGELSMSADGRRVALTRQASTDAPRGDRVVIWKPTTGERITASTGLPDWGRQPAGSASDPAISPDGRFVAFAVQHGDRRRGFRAGIAIRDLKEEISANVLSAVSRRSAERPPYAPLRPSLSARAGALAFQSEARLGGDPDALVDVFVVEDPADRR